MPTSNKAIADLQPGQGGGMFDLSPTGWGRVILVTVVGTVFCVSAAVVVDSVNFPSMTASQLARALALNILLPTLLAAPMLSLLMSKLRELAIARRDLAVIASTR